MKILLLALLLASTISFADEHKNFEENKKEILSRIDKKIAMMNEHKSCVSAASTPDDMKKCRESMKEDRAEFHKEKKEQRGHKIDEKIKKLQELKEKK